MYITSFRLEQFSKMAHLPLSNVSLFFLFASWSLFPIFFLASRMRTICVSFFLLLAKKLLLGIAFQKKENLFLPIFILSFWLTENFISLKIAAKCSRTSSHMLPHFKAFFFLIFVTLIYYWEERQALQFFFLFFFPFHFVLFLCS